MTPYKYIPASLGASARKGTEPKQDYTDLFQATLNEQFYNSSNWCTIERETLIGSEEYEDIDVRMNYVINAETGLKLGDDWRTLLFKEITDVPQMGLYYVFEDNHWLTINIESLNRLAGACTIRRCNNALKWIDEPTGVYYNEPCVVEYLIKEPRDYFTQGSPFKTPGGFLQIHTQYNERTDNIQENQRFLFGNPGHWMAYRVVGAGLNNLRNEETFDNTTTTVLTIDLIADFVNPELDDVVNGIAEFGTNLYEIYLSQDTIQGAIGETIQVTASVLYNNNTVTRTLTWESSNTSVASVSGSGLVTFNSLGACVITASIKNTTYNDTCAVTVTNTPEMNYEILISPDTNYVLEAKERTYTVYLYENNIQKNNTFAITCDANEVPSANYTFTKLDDNSFKIENNLRDMNSHLTITCTSGSYTAKEYDIYLRGAWLQENI